MRHKKGSLWNCQTCRLCWKCTTQYYHSYRNHKTRMSQTHSAEHSTVSIFAT